jgi:hypothetical protein
MKRTITILLVAFAAGAALTGTAAAAMSPGVATGAATDVHDTSAQMHATVNPEGSHTSYQFQYGLTNAYGTSTPVKSAGHGSRVVDVKGTATQLIPGTQYHFRILATSAGGTSVGDDHTFTTTGHPPAVATTGPATSIGKTSATLTGTIEPNGQATTWTFEYGPTTAYGMAVGGGMLPASTAPQTVTAVLQGIVPGTLFHYRLVANHANSTSTPGLDQTFYTFPSPAPKPKIRRFTSPGTDRHRPYVFHTHGSLARHSSIPASVACFGDVQVRYFLGHKQVAGDVVPLSSTCAYSSTATFKHFQGSGRARRARTQRLSVIVHFGGNGYIASANSSEKTVTLG